MPVFIVEPIHRRFALSVPAKVACTTLRFWLWEFSTGQTFPGKCIFEAFRPHTLPMGSPLPGSVEATIAIHRDGVSRLRSVYDHRIRREKEAPDHGLDHFARHLPEYCRIHKSIDHHCRPQSRELGSDSSAFTDIIPLHQLELVREIIGEVTGKITPPLPRMHETRQKTVISGEATGWFTQWTAHDTALGWDGNTLRRFSSGELPASSPG